jgi:transcriptional regulator with XRE-family HTH domain
MTMTDLQLSDQPAESPSSEGLDFDVVTRSGVSQKEFADMLGVSRVTVNRWYNGVAQPSRALNKVVRHALKVFELAIEEELLPGFMPAVHSKNVESRRQYINKALRKAKKLYRRQQQAG